VKISVSVTRINIIKGCTASFAIIINFISNENNVSLSTIGLNHASITEVLILGRVIGDTSP
jgi:hypothetical protein